MKFLVTTSLALWGAMLVSGCGSGTGPATTPFNPFGTEPPGSTSEPPSGSNNPPPATGEGGSGGSVGTGGGGGTVATGGSGGSQTLAQLCASACAQFEAFCSSYQSTTCPTDCTGAVAQFPNCQTQYQAYVSCIATSSYFTCNGTYMPQAPDCVSAQYAVATCAGGA